MTKTELKTKIEKTIDALMNYKMDEMLMQALNEAQADVDKNERAEILKEDLNLLTAWLKEFENDATAKKVDKEDNKKALENKAAENVKKAPFKWLSYDGYKLLSAKESAFESVTINSVIAYRMDKTVIENLTKRGIEYSDVMTFDKAIFDNDIDYCKVIEKTADFIDVESIKNVGATFRIWAENFTKCIDGTNVAFRVCEKIS